MAEYYIVYNGQQVGPMSKEQLKLYGLEPNSQIWSKGMANWAPAYTVPELMEVINGPQQPQPQPQPAYQQPQYQQPALDLNAQPQRQVSAKDKTVCGLLAIFLGGLGIQYFYLERPGAGLICILLSLVSCGLWSTITFIQGIYMLVMNDAEFQCKYVLSTSSFPLL